MKIFDSEQQETLRFILQGVHEDLDRQWLEQDDLLNDYANMMRQHDGINQEKYEHHKHLYSKAHHEREKIHRKMKVIEEFIHKAELGEC